MEELPYWILDIGTQLKTLRRLKQIDNIWFFEESPGFYSPFAVVEHEKDGGIRGVMDRFTALEDTLNSNFHFKDIKPLYFLISESEHQSHNYNNKISEHGRWKEFERSNKFYIFSINQIKNRDPSYVQILTEHIKNTPSMIN